MLDAAPGRALRIGAAAGDGILLAAGRHRRTVHHRVVAPGRQRAVADSGIGDVRDALHVLPVIRRACTITLFGHHRADGSELSGIARRRATRARVRTSALVVAFSFVVSDVPVAALVLRAPVADPVAVVPVPVVLAALAVVRRTASLARRSLGWRRREQPEKDCQNEERTSRNAHDCLPVVT